MSEPRIIVLTAPSGSGKTTIARRLMEAIPALQFSVSATTRPPRQGERDGVDYHFVSQEQFERYLEEGALLEYEQVYPGRYYGTLRREVERASREHPKLLDIDVSGALAVKKQFGDDALTIFVRPPSLDALEERLRKRNTESEDTLRQRLERAEREMNHENDFDLVVVNERLEDAVAETLNAVRGFLAIQPES